MKLLARQIPMATAQPPVKILHLFGCMEPGGAELRTLDILRAVDRQQVAMDFLALSGKPGRLDDTIAALGSSVHQLGLGHGFSRGFQSLLTRHGYDVVHSHVHHVSGYLLKLAAKAGVPKRVAHYRSVSDGHRNLPLRALRNALLKHWVHRYATDICAVSEASMAEAWKINWQQDPRCRVVYNGVPTRTHDFIEARRSVGSELQLPKDARLVLHVGNFRTPKNHRLLLDVFFQLTKRCEQAVLLLVGEDQQSAESRQIRASVTEYAAQHGIADRVLLLGSRDDVLRLLAAADIMLFPSLHEGLPGAVLEAGSTGCPVLASDILPHRELTRFLPSLSLASLEWPAGRWAELLDVQLASGSQEKRRHHCDAFGDSPFQLDASVATLLHIWGLRSGSELAALQQSEAA